MEVKSYAIAEVAGDQVILTPGAKVAVPRLNLEVGSKYIADKILFLRIGDEVKIGTPYIENATIETTVVEHKRLPKVIVFKKKRRKGYKVKRGHKQPYTVIEVSNFGVSTQENMQEETQTTSSQEG